ncbi:helix-turn-helix transcriptional regulator [Serratia ficaria]|uniref:helix-turn-helix transcriptional regulator n=1 Tax=Serratia ficaria TaxID=61651 RepID=UPI00217B1795|nr:hypothetical protein [Serratia ficaria]CAI1509756.1 Uncharacterised protein [Serratia ficaria]
MKRQSLIICLTDNFWLYRGVAAMLPEMNVVRVDYGDTNFFVSAQSQNKKVILVMDMSVFLSGEWTAFDNIIGQKPEAKVIWLKRPDSGLIFPTTRVGDPIIEQKQNFRDLYQQLRGCVFCSPQKQADDFVEPFILTRKESNLLLYLIHDLDIRLIAKWSGIAMKTLYHHRRAILKKAGFARLDMMQLVFRKNLHLLNRK